MMPRTLAILVVVLGMLLRMASARAAGGESCASATPISALPFQDTGTTTGHTDDKGTIAAFCSTYVDTMGPDVVYQLALEAGNSLTIQLTPSDAGYDPSIYLYRSCGAGEMCVSGSDNADVGAAEQFSVSGLAAGTYFLYVDSFYGGVASSSGGYTLSVTGSLGSATTTVTTTSSTSSPTPTTLPLAESICTAGAEIRNAKVKLGNLGGQPGTQAFVLSGTLILPSGRPASLAPLTQGLQILLEDTAAADTALIDLSTLTTPVPPGAVGSGCGPKDGWKKLAYRNRTGAVDPPTCPAGSAQGLDSIRMKDARAKGVGIVFRAHGHGASLTTPAGPLRMTVVLSADADAGARGECGSHLLATCKLKKKRLQCS